MYSTKEVIRKGVLVRSLFPAKAFSVYPIKAGTAVLTATTELEKALFSSMYTPGVAYYPWLNTTIVSASDLSYKNISNQDALVELLGSEVDDNVIPSGAVHS